MAAFCVAFAVAPATAWGASPGDPVPFSISDSELGDSFTIHVEGTQVAAGEDDTAEPGVSGSYSMPDLGSKPRTAKVLTVLTRASDGSTRSTESSEPYTPAAAPKPKSSPSPAPARPAAPGPQPAAPTRPVRPVVPTASPTGGRQRWRRARGDGGSAIEDVVDGTVGVLGKTLSGKADKPKRSARRGKHKPKRRARKRKRNPNAVPRIADPPAVHGRDVESPRDTRQDLSSDEFAGFGYSIAWQLLAAVALTGLLMPLLFAARARARRRRLEEEAALEAELELLVADMELRRDMLGLPPG